MTHTLVIMALVAGISNCAVGFSSEEFNFPVVANEARQLFLTNGTLVTIGYNSFLFGIASLAALAAIAALAYFYAAGDDSGGYSGGYDNSGYASSGSGYSARRAKFNPYSINWESLSILDWISMGQEAYEKFDPANLECQKRLICELHQNKSKFGGPASIMVNLFGYLEYAKVLSLPEELNLVLDEYQDASMKGKSTQKDCGEVYETCDFSANKFLSKFVNTNDI